ncbi:hypothetical protein [Pseudoalteromonas luteoviolacea]|uniref:Uncharacterized protein n=1 Tax=Pseudoalteromonas luteoviolacea NCIMB 1942 TaxID=1365253 RepID=A0A167GKA8_9GAMM|nr:hypothetical protein [Pseudoalteromonas luteoviolacea]KZN55570.1 hypothetical protein N482_24270 [Pseudoalteromonas luteoviolacea NCIMB 1942]
MGKIFADFICEDRLQALLLLCIKRGFIKVDSTLGNLSSSEVESIARFIVQLRHSASVREFLNLYSDSAMESLEQQIENLKSLQDKKQGKTPWQTMLIYQHSVLTRIGKKAHLVKDLGFSDQSQSVLYPNIVIPINDEWVTCYCTVAQCDYERGHYKDAFLDEKNALIVKQDTQSGKFNIGINNPYRALSWYYNYVNQGFDKAAIRAWQIPTYIFMDLAAYSLDENKTAQLKKAKAIVDGWLPTEYIMDDKAEKLAKTAEQNWNELSRKERKLVPIERAQDLLFDAKKLFNETIESCDYRAPNQFGWYIDKQSGLYQLMVEKAKNFTTYTDTVKNTKVDERDGNVIDIKELETQLGLSDQLKRTTFQDMGTTMVKGDGHFEQSNYARLQLTSLLNVSFAVEKGATVDLEKLTDRDLKIFCAVLSYNGMNPEQMLGEQQLSALNNTGTKYQCVKKERQLADQIYQQNWAKEVVATLNRFTPVKNKAGSQLRRLLGEAEIDSKVKVTDIIQSDRKLDMFLTSIDGSNSSDVEWQSELFLALRPLMSSSSGGKKIDKKDKFVWPLLKSFDFAVGGDSSRMLAKYLPEMPKNREAAPGLSSFNDPLQNSLVPSSFTPVQIFQLKLDNDVFVALKQAGFPLLSGISGTTRDFFRFIDETEPFPIKLLLSMMAFMNYFHFHTMAECFAAAIQFCPQAQLRELGLDTIATPDELYEWIETQLEI